MDTALAGRAVLIAEDEFLVAFHWESVLEDQGARVSAVASVAEGLEIADQGFDGAVLDVSLLDGDVFPVADRLQKNGTPFVFHSGHALLDDLAARYPRSEAVAKPASEGMLIGALTRVMACRDG